MSPASVLEVAEAKCRFEQIAPALLAALASGLHYIVLDHVQGSEPA